MPDQSLNRPASGRNDANPLTYADYLRSVPQGSESSGAVMSEAQWNALTPEARFALVGGGFMIDKNDPRYSGLSDRTGGEDGRNIVVSGDGVEDANFTDPNLVHRGDGYTSYRESSMTPEAQAKANASGLSDKQWAALVASMFGGAAAFGGGLAGAGAEAAGGSGLASIPGDLAVGGASGGGSAALADLPEILSAGQVGGAGAAGGGLAGLGQAASSGALGTIPESALGSLPLTTVGGSSAALAELPAITSGGASAGSSLLNALGGPSGIARGALGLASLGASAGGGGSNGGGSTDANSIIEQMARANRVNQTTPFGSRTWSQGPDGQWSVADTLSAPEQANFTNVQGMNADVTGMARQRLAAMLAAPQRQRYDRPLGT